MLKKWKKSLKLFGTTVLVLIYVTIGLFSNETLKEEKRNKKRPTFVFDTAPTTERYLGTVKTIIGYSKEFTFLQELKGQIECNADNYPDVKEEDKAPGTWKIDKELGIKVFSAYYDQRLDSYRYVRIIGLLQKNSSFYCQIWYQDTNTTTHTTQKAVLHKIWSDDWGPKNKTDDSEIPAIISCPAPLRTGLEIIPSYVSFVDSSCSGSGTFIKITPPTLSQKLNFVICVKPLNLTNIDLQSLVEWADINWRLGADKIDFYLSNTTDFSLEMHDGFLARKAFSMPQSESISFRTFEETVWHKRKMEIIAYNDCFYSNLYHTKFVIPLDVDEIIVPKTENNWLEAFSSFFLNGTLAEDEKKSSPEDFLSYASYSVRNAYFFPQYPKDAIIRSLMLPNHDRNVPKKLVKVLLNKNQFAGNSIFDRTIRSYRLSPKTDSVKSFIFVPKTLSVFNHYAFHVLENAVRQFVFPPSVLQLNHYRDSCDPVLIDECQNFLKQVVFDDSLNKFRNKTKT